ncbi:MAG: sigma-70 family RNA polymerase sigma factor [Bacteroidia bacterium]|nr:sigma-70 family RNA polymerase sigma factor [Bacteroidia bacterium]
MESSEDYTDGAIIKAIENGGSQLESVMLHFYKDSAIRAKVYYFIKQNNGNIHDAEDIFQDGMKNLIISVRSKRYKATGSVEAYIFATCRNLWYKKFKNKIREKPDVEINYTVEDLDPLMVLEKKEKLQVVDELMGKLGDKCRRVLELWNLDYSMKEIAEKLEYKSEGMARKKKHECLQKLLLHSNHINKISNL